jgi:hypothetical protein
MPIIRRHVDPEDAASASLGRSPMIDPGIEAWTCGTANDSEIPASFYADQDEDFTGYDGLGYRVGCRVELHPGLDRWMRGDRYGEVTRSLRHGRVEVKTDRGATLKAFPRQFRAIALAALALLLPLPTFATEPCSINVNTATPVQLQLFARTGPVLAGKLASGRPYKTLPDVDAVKGIGPAWLSINRPHVAFSGPTTCTAKIATPKTPRVAAPSPLL